MPTSARIRTWSLALLLAVVAAGCGSQSFVGKRLNNFTAYYNTFYNARQAYQSGVSAMEESTEPVDRRHYISVFGGPGRSGGNVNFQSAIDKCADVLRDHPTSKWVDDALMLIGKSYFYQENFVGAEQKFREVIEAETVLEDEARIWLARTLIAAGAHEEARDHLVTSLEQEDLSQRWEPDLRLALGELYVKLQSFEDAARELEAGLEDVRDNDIEAKAAFLLGQVYETIGRYEESVEAYRHVKTVHPRYELSFAADLSAVRVQGMHLDAVGALEELRRMQRDDKNYSSRYELAYLRGRIYQAQGRALEARAVYRDILYDREAEISALRGRLHYALAELYRDEFDDYLVSAAHFDSARTALGSSVTPRSGGAESTIQYAPEAVTDAQQQAEVFGSFAGVRREIARMDSLLELGALDEEAFSERILEIRRQKAQELLEQQRRAEELQAQRGFQDAATRTNTSTPGTSSASENTGEAGFLYHRDPIRIQEARLNFVGYWGDRPLVPNWRRMEAVTAAASLAQNSAGQQDGVVRGIDPTMSEEPLPPLDYSDVPRDSLSRARMEAERALARYELGNVLFLSMNRPDSAAAWYRKVIDEDTEEEVAQRAFYALAEVQSSLGDSVTATRLYEQVLREYPDSDFAGRVREMLGLSQPVTSDSLATALEAYETAFSRWGRGLYRDAFDRMIEIAAAYRDTEMAPKALLAAGRIFMEWADADSLDVFGPLPTAVPDSTLELAGLRSSLPAVAVDSIGAATEDREAGSEELDLAASETLDAEAMERSVELAEEDRPRLRVEADPTGGEADPTGGEPAVDDVPIAFAARGAEAPGGVPAAAPRDTTAVGPRDTTAAGAPGSTGVPPAVTDSAGIAGAGGSVGVGRVADSTAEAVVTDSAAEAVVTDSAAVDGAGRADMPPADTTAGVPDAAPLVASSDTSGAALSAVPSDSLRADSSGTGLASTQWDASAVPEAPEPLDLSALYASVRDLFPSTPYAEQAAVLLAALEQRRMDLQALADSAAAAESLAAADSLAADSLVTTVPDSSLAIAPDSSLAVAGLPTGEACLYGDGGIRPELGGYTIVLDTNVQSGPMQAIVEQYADQGFRAGIVTETIGDTTLYRAAVGHFPTADAASSALESHRDDFEQGAEITPIRHP